MVQTLCSQAFSHNGDPCVTPDDITDCPVPGSLRQAPRRDVQPRAGEFRRRRRSCSRQPSACTASSRRLPSPTSARRRRFGTRSRSWSDSGSSASRAVIPTATTRTTWRRMHPQAAARADPVAGAPLASRADDLAVRERRGPRRALPNGAGVGGERGRLLQQSGMSAPPASAGVAGHHRSGPDRRPDAWRATDTFFNGHYASWCYLPLLGFLTFNDEKEQYLCAAVLRPGKAVAADGTLGLLCRAADAAGGVSVDAVSRPARRGLCDPGDPRFPGCRPGLDYVVAMAKNAVLQRHAESAMAVARAQSEASGRTEHVYTDTRYAAGTWGHERRVVIKAEVVRLKGREPRDNPRPS